MKSHIEQFRDAMISAGITNPPAQIIDDGQIHRFSTNNKSNDNAGWYVLYADNIPAGHFADYRTGIDQKWCSSLSEQFTPTEKKEYQKRIEAICQKRELEEKQRNEDSRIKAEKIWNKAIKAPDNHPYLLNKKVKSYGLKTKGDKLIVPLRNNGLLCSLQFISSEQIGKKKFLFGGRVKGGYFSIGSPKDILCICEGYATGASIFEATGFAVAVAFTSGNLLTVSLQMRQKFPDFKIILCSDDDITVEGNPGLCKANEAASAVDGLLAVPNFGNSRPQGMSDFNDLACFQSLESVKQCIENARPPTTNSDNISSVGNEISKGHVHDDVWVDPMPLLSSTDELYPYPIDALPPNVRTAVQEVADSSRCPLSMVACSALSALSVASQGLANVCRDRNKGLTGPISLFIMVIADSGERKTSCDKLFIDPIRKWEKIQYECSLPELKRHEAALSAWTAEVEGVKAKIKELAKKQLSSDIQKECLERLEMNKPKRPKIPSLIYGDTTTEALAWNLFDRWPSGGVLSSEAGIVFGGHSMRSESAMSNFSFLNVMWDGGTHKVGRKTSESFTISEARLTMGLAVQSETVRSFFSTSKNLARGSGFAARFLIAWPTSTQGERMFTETPPLQYLNAFNTRIQELLDQTSISNEQGELNPTILELSPKAKSIWIAFHDDVEREQKINGTMADIRDVASKAADNAARLAALFHIFEYGVHGMISPEHLHNAARIVAWHLYESRRFFNELSIPKPIRHAMILDTWLIQECKEKNVGTFSTRHIQQNCPYALRRDHDARNNAVKMLIENGHIRIEEQGQQKLIHINPKLLEKNHGTI